MLPAPGSTNVISSGDCADCQGLQTIAAEVVKKKELPIFVFSIIFFLGPLFNCVFLAELSSEMC